MAKITQADLDDMIKNEAPSRFVREWFGELLTKEDYDALINNPSSFPLNATRDFDAGVKKENIDGKMSWLREHDGEMAKFGVAGNGEDKDKCFVIPLKQSYVVVDGPLKGMNTLKYIQTLTNTVSSEFGFAEGFELSYTPPAETGGVGGKGTFSATQTFGFSTSKTSTRELTASVNPEDTSYALAPSMTYAVIQTWSSFGWGKYQVKEVFKATGRGVTIVTIVATAAAPASTPDAAPAAAADAAPASTPDAAPAAAADAAPASTPDAAPAAAADAAPGVEA